MKAMYSGGSSTWVPAGNWMSSCPSCGIGLPILRFTIAFSTAPATPVSKVTEVEESDDTSRVMGLLFPVSMRTLSNVRVVTVS